MTSGSEGAPSSRRFRCLPMSRTRSRVAWTCRRAARSGWQGTPDRREKGFVLRHLAPFRARRSEGRFGGAVIVMMGCGG